ncbi:MAG: M28 family peptidase [Faecousia sp.]
MIDPMDVLKLFPVRKSGKQKQAFRACVKEYLEGLGYCVSFEQGSLHSQNVVVGDPEKAKYLVTAHYDTCARMFVPNLITPCNLLLFILYQIFVCLLLIVPTFAVAALVGYLFHSYIAGYWLWMVLLWGSIAMMLIGPANSSNANDNTSGVVSVLEIAKSLQEKYRKDVCFVLFDLEEAGLIGSASYRKAHKKASNSQLVLNLDCVGEGNEILFFPTARLKKDKKKLDALEKITGQFGKKSITVRSKGFSIYPSDQGHFPYGVGICALNRGKAGLYLSKIHTPRDTSLDETNVNILRAAIITLISGSAAQ